MAAQRGQERDRQSVSRHGPAALHRSRAAGLDSGRPPGRSRHRRPGHRTACGAGRARDVVGAGPGPAHARGLAWPDPGRGRRGHGLLNGGLFRPAAPGPAPAGPGAARPAAGTPSGGRAALRRPGPGRRSHSAHPRKGSDEPIPAPAARRRPRRHHGTAGPGPPGSAGLRSGCRPAGRQLHQLRPGRPGHGRRRGSHRPGHRWRSGSHRRHPPPRESPPPPSGASAGTARPPPRRRCRPPGRRPAPGVVATWRLAWRLPRRPRWPSA